MGSYLDIIYCIILFAFVIYNAILIYRNYKCEEAFGAGYSKIVNTLGTIFLLIGFIFITSYTVVIVPLILTSVFYLLFLILLKRHNQTHHSGDVFLFLQNEIRKNLIRVWIMLGLLFVCVILTYGQIYSALGYLRLGKPANKCQALIFCNAANFRFFLAFAQQGHNQRQHKQAGHSRGQPACAFTIPSASLDRRLSARWSFCSDGTQKYSFTCSDRRTRSVPRGHPPIKARSLSAMAMSI